MVEKILIVVGITIVTIVLLLLLSFLVNKSKKLNSKENFIKSMLPGLDCGKCGYASCIDLSKEISEENADASQCPYINRANLSKIKRVIKKGYYNDNNLVAFVKCKGGEDCKTKFDYAGQNYCWCKDSLHSGNKQCNHACLGCGDCVKVCRYGALYINKKGVAEVNREKCTGCGACTYVCPNNLIVRIPVKQSVNVVCDNFDDKEKVLDKCKVGCTMCGKCVQVCPVKAISIKKGKPVINPNKCINCNKCIGVCPNQCISRL